MSTEGEIHVPAGTPRYELPRQQPASSRPGPAAPRPDHGAVDLRIDDCMAAIHGARELWRVARAPLADASYPHLRPWLLVAEARLLRQLHEDPQDAASAELLREVRRYLGRHA